MARHHVEFDYKQFDYPESSSALYDALNSSEESKIALRRGEISVGAKLDKYLAISRRRFYASTDFSKHEAAKIPPEPFKSLLDMQDRITGKWDHIDQVLHCLHMPLWARIEDAPEMLQATFFAVAAIRQNYELFNLLGNAHDKAAMWIEDNEDYITVARELLSEHQHRHIGNSSKDFFRDEDQRQKDYETHVENIHVNAIRSNQAEGDIARNDQSDSIQSTTTSQDYLESESIQTLETDGSYLDTFSDKIQSVSLKSLDLMELTSQQKKVNDIQLKLIEKCLYIEDRIEELRHCKERCVRNFNKANTPADRNWQFDELTAMLGDGIDGREGFLDWRAQGVRGIRPDLIDFFCTVQEMAEERLLLEEVKTPWGRTTEDKANKCDNSRWGLMWNGKDLVHTIMHSLDFLRECRELCEWYGRDFTFLANPLALPTCQTSLEDMMKQLCMQDQISQQMATQPHLRVGSGKVPIQDNLKDWRFDKYLKEWAIKFTKLCTRKREICWPTAPLIIGNAEVSMDEEARICVRMHTALLVIMIRCGDSVSRTAEYEKKFIKLAMTKRGNYLMQGEKTIKPVRKLNIPIGTFDMSNSNQSFIGKSECLSSPRNNNHEYNDHEHHHRNHHQLHHKSSSQSASVLRSKISEVVKSMDPDIMQKMQGTFDQSFFNMIVGVESKHKHHGKSSHDHLASLAKHAQSSPDQSASSAISRESVEAYALRLTNFINNSDIPGEVDNQDKMVALRELERVSKWLENHLDHLDKESTLRSFPDERTDCNNHDDAVTVQEDVVNSSEIGSASICAVSTEKGPLRPTDLVKSKKATKELPLEQKSSNVNIKNIKLAKLTHSPSQNAKQAVDNTVRSSITQDSKSKPKSTALKVSISKKSLQEEYRNSQKVSRIPSGGPSLVRRTSSNPGELK